MVGRADGRGWADDGQSHRRPWLTGLLFLALLVGVMVGPGQGEGRAADVNQLKRQAKQYYWGQGVPQDYRRALQLYLQAARLGDADAQYIAGGMYFKGQGTTADFQQAFKLLYQAARNGKSTPESQKLLAQAFIVGDPVPKNYPEAVKWYQQAAVRGDRDAQNELAFLYFVGRGVEQDLAKAHDLFRQAALNGLPLAQYNLGIMLYTGNGVEQADLVEAYAWFNLAASAGNGAAASARQFLESALTASELATAQEKSRTLYEAMPSASSSALP